MEQLTVNEMLVPLWFLSGSGTASLLLIIDSPNYTGGSIQKNIPSFVALVMVVMMMVVESCLGSPIIGGLLSSPPQPESKRFYLC